MNKYSAVILIAVFILSFIIRLHEFNIFKDFNSDKARQLNGAYNYMHGQGMSYVSYDLNTFEVLTSPVLGWPPAYPFFAMAISSALHTDLYTASLYFDVFMQVLLWLALLAICRQGGLSNWQQILFFLFVGCSKTILQPIWSSDMTGTTFFMLSCALNMWYVQHTQHKTGQSVLFFVSQFMLLSLTILMKYSLAPVLLAVAFSVGAFYYHSKDKRYLRTSIILTVLAVAGFGMMYAYNQSISGSHSVVAERYSKHDEGFIHLYNLRFFYPFILDSIFCLGPFSSRLNSNMVNNVSAVITVILFFWIAYELLKSIRNKAAGYFEYVTLVTLLFVTGFLVLLSLKLPRDIQGDGISWTYVKEYRYYFPAVLLLLIYLFKTYDPFAEDKKKISALRYLVLPAVIYTTGLWAYYTYIGNRANSFEALYGKVFNVGNDVKQMADEQTCFVSLTGNMMFDTQLTSKVALSGVKVAISYYGYFPDSTFKTPFNNKAVPAGKKIIYYLGDNTKMIDSVSAVNKYTIDRTADGEQFLVIKN